MSGTWIALLLCALSLATNLVVHLLVYRMTRGYMRSIFTGFAAGFFLLAVGEAFRFASYSVGATETLVLLVGDLVIYGCISFLFFNFINAGESSIRIRILRELRAVSEPLSEDALLKKYNDRLILDARLGRMVRNRQIEFVDGHYRLLSLTLVRMADFFCLLKRLLLRRTSEFDSGGK